MFRQIVHQLFRAAASFSPPAIGRHWFLWMALFASILPASVACGQVLGFVDDFSSAGTSGWTSNNSNTNPGTGGVGGAGDGYLNIAQLDFVFNFGTHNDGPNYAGDWAAAGITRVSFYLNDVDTDDNFSFHFLVTGDESNPNGESTWLYNPGFDPPNNSWQKYSADLTSDANWTRTARYRLLRGRADRGFRRPFPPR